MRQVINKLITEEDLYAAVDNSAARRAGAGEALRPHRPAHRGRRDTLDVRQARTQRSEGRPPRQRARPAPSRSAASCPSRTRRSSRSAKLGLRAPPQGREGARRAATHRRPGPVARPAGATLRPRASSAGGTGVIGRVIERYWRDGGTFQEWGEHFDLDRWLEAMAARASTPLIRRAPATAPSTTSCPGRVTAGLHKDFLWGDWQAALHEHGLPDCRWTPCYDCGVSPATGSSTSWRRRSPPAGGSQGTGQDLTVGGAVPVKFLSGAGSGGSR